MSGFSKSAQQTCTIDYKKKPWLKCFSQGSKSGLLPLTMTVFTINVGFVAVRVDVVAATFWSQMQRVTIIGATRTSWINIIIATAATAARIGDG